MSKRLVPYDNMVKNLFKVEGMSQEPKVIAFMHAAIGICGEVGEIHSVETRTNLLEELGDLTFYIEAARQSLDPRNNRFGIQDISSASILPAMCILSADLLDVAKKSWVYGKPIDSDKAHNILDQLECGLFFLCRMNGFTPQEVRTQNQDKLGVRFPDGVYTNEHAQARLDKQGVHRGA